MPADRCPRRFSQIVFHGAARASTAVFRERAERLSCPRHASLVEELVPAPEVALVEIHSVPASEVALVEIHSAPASEVALVEIHSAEDEQSLCHGLWTEVALEGAARPWHGIHLHGLLPPRRP